MSFFRHVVLNKYVLLSVTSLILVYTFLHGGGGRLTRTGWPSEAPPFTSKLATNNSRPACYGLPGSDDVVVVMKTGSTELRDKLPVHLETTLRCYTDYLIFSDVEEVFQGELILDALESVDANVKAQHQDFDLWRRLQKSGRAALKNSELSGPVNPPRGGGGKDNNPGWTIDKWKFLPMMNRTLHEYPHKKWYVFVETDTFLFWHSLLEYLSRLDWQKPHYLGAQINIGDIAFAHGGAGFVASRPAMEQVVAMFIAHQKEWEDFTDGHWAGDCVLGKAFKDSGTPLLGAFPIFQGDPVGNMNYATNNMWCGPTASYHHSSPSIVRDLFEFQEQSIMQAQASKHKAGYLSHKDVFATYVLPRTTEPRMNWDNHCDEDQGPVESLEACRVICDALKTCVQYSVNTAMRCSTTARPNLGDAARGVDSGWIHSRMQKFFDNVERCRDDGIWHDYE